MEPIHYVRALRRRWWVIVASILVGGLAAWVTTTLSPSASSTPAATVFTATTVLWNPGIPSVGQGAPITDIATLAQIVTFPDVATIAAKTMHYQGSPLALRSQIQAAADTSGLFLNITGTASQPRRAERISAAFSDALTTYLEGLKVKQFEQQRRALQDELATLQKQNADPTVIASIRSAQSQLTLDRSTPVGFTTIQEPIAEPVSAQPTTSSGGIQPPKSPLSRALVGAVIGLLAGLSLALVLERFDSKIRTRQMAEEAVGLPVLAEVPVISRRRRKRVVTATDPTSRAGDAFRLLSAGIARWSFHGNGRANGNGKPTAPSLPPTAILVTSPETRDGKTTVAANLAAAYAETGNRVLVVSCNFRRPGTHRIFGMPDGPGLSALLTEMENEDADEGSTDLSAYVEPCSIVRVALLPSGGTPNRPAELLGSASMQRFLDSARKLTDILILDCASLQVASDVAPLLPQVDAVVLVTRAGKTTAELAASTKNLLERLGANVVGVVVNKTKEFSIPARRRLYRQTRQTAKEAQKSRVQVPPQPAPHDRQRDMWAGLG